MQPSLPSPSKIVSEIHYQYHRSKSPTKPRIFSQHTSPKKSLSSPKKLDEDHPNPKKTNSEHDKLNLHGVNLFKHEDNQPDQHEQTHIANLIWDGVQTEQHKDQYITPIPTRVNTARANTAGHRYLPSLTNSIQITHLATPRDKNKFNHNAVSFDTPYSIYTYPILPTYLPMSTLEDCTVSRSKELCDYELYTCNPKHNAQITERLNRKLTPKVLFQIYPTKSFKKMNRLTVPKRNFNVNLKKENVISHHKLSYFTNNNHKLSDDTDDNIDTKAYQVFDINKKAYAINNDLPNIKLFQNKQVESTLVPYKRSTLSMRNDCTKFRKKWS